jgi:hypothetical protein
MWSSLLGGKSKRSSANADAKPASKLEAAMGPPLTAEEINGNLSDLERGLNREMKCPAGKNQVYIRSLLTGSGTTKPRIALKCHLRKDLGQTPEVYIEHIRSVCCTDPGTCEAYRNFKDRLVPT